LPVRTAAKPQRRWTATPQVRARRPGLAAAPAGRTAAGSPEAPARAARAAAAEAAGPSASARRLHRRHGRDGIGLLGHVLLLLQSLEEECPSRAGL